MNILGHPAILAAAVAICLPSAAVAQAFPDKPITIVVSGQVGGTVDAMTRQFAPYWEKALGQSIVVENKSGAAGVTGVRYYLEQPDDGYAVMIGTEAHYSAAMEKDPDLKSTDVEIINMHEFDPAVFTVLETSRFTSLEDLVKEVQQTPKSVSWGSPPTGAPALIGKLVAKNWSLDMRFIPQAGGVESDTALLGGHVDLKVGTATGDSSELPGARLLAVAAPARLAFLPDVPTFNEVGAKLGFSQEIPSLGSARIVLVRASVKADHPDAYAKLTESYKAAFHDPDYQAVLKQTNKALAASFDEPDVATKKFRDLVENTIKYKKELAE